MEVQQYVSPKPLDLKEHISPRKMKKPLEPIQIINPYIHLRVQIYLFIETVEKYLIQYSNQILHEPCDRTVSLYQ